MTSSQKKKVRRVPTILTNPETLPEYLITICYRYILYRYIIIYKIELPDRVIFKCDLIYIQYH